MNGEPHLGHAYTTIAADVLARHMRQRGEDVFFLTGTDEHGEPVAQAAERSASPRASWATATRCASRSSPRTVNATNDFFIRTTDPEHMAKVAEVVQRIHDNGHVYAGHLRGLVLPALRRLQDRVRARGRQPLPDPQDRARDARRRTTGSSGCPPSRSRSSASTPSAPTSSRPRNRYNEALVVHQERPARRLAQPRRGSSGACRCRGTSRRSSTSGSTRSSTTTRRSPTRARART